MTIFGMPRRSSTCRRPRPSFGIRGGGCETRSVPSRARRHAPTQLHHRATHRSVHCVRSFNDLSTLHKQNLTWVGIECRPLRAQQDSVSTDGQHHRFASPSHTSRQLVHKQCQNLHETGVPDNISILAKRDRKSHTAHQIPRPIS